MTPQFKARLNREIKLYLQELHDCCADCIALGKGNYCEPHHKDFCEIQYNPQKFIHIPTAKDTDARP